jgi:hydrogenase maturation protein HypF
MSEADATRGFQVTVTGVVQGVGFRPFVHRLATEIGLTGHVSNDSTGVSITVEGRTAGIESFASRLVTDAPPLAIIETVTRREIPPTGRQSFDIVESRTTPGPRSPVSPDMAVCENCLAELFDPADRRYRHPFITCTDCGPRYTITRSLPYDRPNTTMSGFVMCRTCRTEYDDPTDRRHHAQPIGCHDCGPRLALRSADGGATATDDPIGETRRTLAAGLVAAIKGIGGYHLACDAADDRAVALLRARKHRPDKPFAVMTADLDRAALLAHINDDEAALLESPARPIVLLRARTDNGLSPLVAPANPLLGVMLPYTPVHHLLLAGSESVLVMTSANPPGEPILFRDDHTERLVPLSDVVLSHDRPIHIACDDSVVRVADGHLLPLRRARGYAPLPVRLHRPRRRDVLAVGGDLKNTCCVTSDSHAWVSPHLGDMDTLATLDAFGSTVAHLTGLYDIDPTTVAADAHPGYRSSHWARTNHPAETIEVQHHHAHVASVMAEHGLDPDRAVLGFAFDGTGYGTDGAIWGGEAMVADASGFRRVAHLAPVLLPGGDLGVRNPCRMSLAYLFAAGIDWSDDLDPVAHLDGDDRRVLQHQLETGFGCVPTTSMGRLFDAVASLVGLRHEISFEAQAAIDLEIAADAGEPALHYQLGLGPNCIEHAPLVAAVVADRRRGVPVGEIAAAFHRAVADAVVAIAARTRHDEHPDLATAALSGGVFQNALLLRLCREGLTAAGFDVRSHSLVPPNDGGLALGQAFIAAHRRQASRHATD